MVAVDTHEAVTLVVPGTGLEGAVDGDQVVDGSQAVAVGVHVGEQTALWRGGKEREKAGGVILYTHTPSNRLKLKLKSLHCIYM